MDKTTTLVLLAALTAWACVCSQAERVTENDSSADSLVDNARDVSAPVSGESELGDESRFCVVIRTYRGHGTDEHSGLPRMLRSLQRQNVTSWEAVIIVMDGLPFDNLHQIVRSMNDSRIWVFAEWVGTEFQARHGDDWAPNYHAMLYNLTDDAIQVCPPRTEWLLVTNGDNEYGAGFLSRALAEGGSDQVQGAEGGMEHGGRADIVAFDFYSRFQRVTAPSCKRFAVQTQGPLCKRNRMRWCHTDLGANVLRYARFVSEGRSFGGPLAPESGLGAPHADGLLAQSLAAAGWRVRHVTDACLFSHAPNAQSCAWQHGVWDDREVGPGAGDAAGGECLTHGQAEWVLRNDPNAEILDITAASDGHVEVFEGVSATPELTLTCLRRKDYAVPGVWGATMDWYSELCADDADLPDFAAWKETSARLHAQHAADEASATLGDRADPEAGNAPTHEAQTRDEL